MDPGALSAATSSVASSGPGFHHRHYNPCMLHVITAHNCIVKWSYQLPTSHMYNVCYNTHTYVHVSFYSYRILPGKRPCPHKPVLLYVHVLCSSGDRRRLPITWQVIDPPNFKELTPRLASVSN